jgi:hypothetical protein
MKVAGGKTVYRQYTPEKGIDLVDHMRVQMLSEHGPSKTSRKRGGDIATDIANAVSGVVPRGMKQIGVQKTAVSSEEGTVEGTKPLLVPKAPKGRKAGEKPNPPKAKRGEVLVGLKGPGELPTFISKGPKASQPYLPGTGVPKPVVEQTSPAQYRRVEGPLEKFQTEKIGQRASVASKPWTEEDLAPKIQTAKETSQITGYTPTDRSWKPESNRGQQFALDTTDMTGAGEVAALSKSGSLVKPEKKAKKVKPMEQASLFPDFEVTEGRSNAFYMAGSTKPISEASKTLQGAADKPFGKQPNNKDFLGDDSADSVVDRLKVGPKKKAD